MKLVIETGPIQHRAARVQIHEVSNSTCNRDWPDPTSGGQGLEIIRFVIKVVIEIGPLGAGPIKPYEDLD